MLHRTDKRDGDHVHAIVRTGTRITKSEVDAAWSRCFPARRYKAYHNNMSYLAEATNLRKLLYYLLMEKDGELRPVPAWGDLPVKSPIILRSITPKTPPE